MFDWWSCEPGGWTRAVKLCPLSQVHGVAAAVPQSGFLWSTPLHLDFWPWCWRPSYEKFCSAQHLLILKTVFMYFSFLVFIWCVDNLSTSIRKCVRHFRTHNFRYWITTYKWKKLFSGKFEVRLNRLWMLKKKKKKSHSFIQQNHLELFQQKLWFPGVVWCFELLAVSIVLRLLMEQRTFYCGLKILKY